MKNKVMSAAAVALATAALATGCGGNTEQAAKPSADVKSEAASVCQKAVANEMKDPSSAQFRNVTVGDAMPASDETEANSAGVPTATKTGGQYWKVSGEVNAANSFGGMVGFRTFNCEAELYDGSQMESGYVNVQD